MEESRGVEPHPILHENLVFKTSRRTIPTALLSICLVHPAGYDPASTIFQTAAMTTSAKGALKIGSLTICRYPALLDCLVHKSLNYLCNHTIVSHTSAVC